MIKYLINLLCVVCIFSCVSCDQPKRCQLTLLLQTDIDDNGDDGRFNTKIGYRPGVFHTEHYRMAKSAGFVALDTIRSLWINGKEVPSSLDFDALAAKYKTHAIRIEDLFKSDEFADSLFYQRHRLLNEKQAKGAFHGSEHFLTLEDNTYVQLLDTAGPQILLRFYKDGVEEEQHLKSYSELFPASLKALDIDGDGRKEVLVVCTGFSYWGASANVRVFKVP